MESNREAADSISQVLFEIVSTVQERGRFQETIDTVKLGLEWIFPYTSTHSLSFTLFLFDAEGALGKPGDLETLLTTALEKASTGVKESGSRGEKAKPGRGKKSKKRKKN